MRVSVLFLFSILSLNAFGGDNVLNVFVLTGQSNSLGIIKDGESWEVRKDKIDEKIKFYWVNRNSKSKVVSTSKEKISHLQVQYCGENKKTGNYGLEISCMRDLYKSGMKNIMLIKASRGGGGNSLWLKGSQDDHMYRAVIEAVEGAIKQLQSKKIKFRIVGLLYLQGESDGGDAEIADVRAKQLLDNLRKDLPEAEDMKMFIGGIGGPDSRSGTARKKHKELAKRDRDVTFIDTSDLLDEGQYTDNLHFNNASKKEIGKRFAKAIKKN